MFLRQVNLCNCQIILIIYKYKNIIEQIKIQISIYMGYDQLKVKSMKRIYRLISDLDNNENKI